MESYWLSVLGVLALCLLSVALAIYSGSSKGFAGKLAGPVIPADDDNPLYRIDRVHMNSVEALAPFVVPAVLAMMAGVGPGTLAVLVWIHLAIRLMHMAVYLRGGNVAKGGSVRTILYVSGALVTLILILVRDGRRFAEQRSLFAPTAEPSPRSEVHPLCNHRRCAMDHTSHVRLTNAELTPDILEGATIYGPDDEKIGSVDHLHGSQVVIDVGGFLGIGAKPVAVAASQLDFMRDEDGDVHAVTSWTKDQLKAMPEHRD